MFVRGCVTALTFLFLPQSLLPAWATVESGQSFYEKWVEKNRGTLDPNIDQYLHGYVAGMYDAFEEELYVCAGENVKMSSLIDGLGLYLQKNPRFREYPIRAIFKDAILTEWQCN